MQNKKIKSGLLLVNKPQGITTTGITHKIKKQFKLKKIGHGGTLDPFATGLMSVFIGEATKLAFFSLTNIKSYQAILQLGIQTDTGDKDGKLIKTSPIFPLKDQELKKAFFTISKIKEQQPPMFSAIKYKGKKLYQYARQQKIVPVKKRPINILSLVVENYKNDEITFFVRCSKGTYIRTLGEDISKELGMVGHLIYLCRYSVGDWNLKQALNLDDILKMNLAELNHQIIDLENILNIDTIKLNTLNSKRIKLGQRIFSPEYQEDEALVQVFSASNKLIALALIKNKVLHPQRIILDT